MIALAYSECTEHKYKGSARYARVMMPLVGLITYVNYPTQCEITSLWCTTRVVFELGSLIFVFIDIIYVYYIYIYIYLCLCCIWDSVTSSYPCQTSSSSNAGDGINSGTARGGDSGAVTSHRTPLPFCQLCLLLCSHRGSLQLPGETHEDSVCSTSGSRKRRRANSWSRQRWVCADDHIQGTHHKIHSQLLFTSTDPKKYPTVAVRQVCIQKSSQYLSHPYFTQLICSCEELRCRNNTCWNVMITM